MRQPAVIVILLLFAFAGAPDATAREGSGGRSYFGGPAVRYTIVRDQGALLFGGRGGLNLTPTLTIGGGLYGTMNEVDGPTGAVADAPGPLDVRFDNFGFDVEYAPRPAAPTHLTFGAFFGGGAARYVRNRTNEQHGETDFMLLLEPGVGVEQTVAEWLHLNLAASYRVVSGVEQPGLKDSDFHGPAAALTAKIGRF